jgi:hypothetical protein
MIYSKERKLRLNAIVLILTFAFSGIASARDCVGDFNGMGYFPGGIEIKGNKVFFEGRPDEEVLDGREFGDAGRPDKVISIKRDSSKRPISVTYQSKYDTEGGGFTYDYSSGKCEVVRESYGNEVVYDRSLCKDLTKLSKELGADFNRCNDLFKKAGERVEKFTADLTKQNLKFVSNPTAADEKLNKGQVTLKALGNCEMMESPAPKRRVSAKPKAATPAAPAKVTQ